MFALFHFQFSIVYLLYMATNRGKKHNKPPKASDKGGGGDAASRINALISNRCIVSRVVLSKALGIPPQLLVRYMNSPIVYLSINQIILLSFYLNLSLNEVLSVIGSDQLALSFPPSFFDAVHKRNLKVNGEYVGNNLPQKDATSQHWYD